MRTIENITQLEQVKITNMWTGSHQLGTYQMYVLNNNEFRKEEIKFAPSWYKIIDEIIVNAIDHWVNFPKLVTYIKIRFDDSDGSIYVENNGPSIGIEKKKNILGQDLYVAQMAASDFNTSSNYRTAKRYTGGVNGAGLKLTNAFSDWLILKTGDSKKRKEYIQKFENRLEKINSPILKDYNGDDYTSIHFLPSYKVFGYKKGYEKKYADDLFKLIQVRTYHAAIYTTAKIILNDAPIEFHNTVSPFIEFSKKHLSEDCNELYYTKLEHPEEPVLDIAIGVSNGKFEHVSIINGVNVYDGGNYITHIQNLIVDNLRQRVEKLLKSAKIKFNRNMIINSLFIFIKGKIVNPEFESQVKNKIMNPIENFKEYTFKKKDWGHIWEIVGPYIELNFLNKAQDKEKKRVNRGEVNVPKCYDAQHAGSLKYSKQCMLWIAEGDAACGTIKRGIVDKCSKLDFKFCGTFNIGGVPMNCRTKCVEKINPKTKEKIIIKNNQFEQNERFSSLVKVLGLDYTKTYDPDTEEGNKEFESLRYGKVIVAVDQDVDGHGIFGLIINFFEYFWPCLLKRKFVSKFNTPIIRAFTLKKDKPDRNNRIHEFYSMPQFKDWISKEFNGEEEKAKSKFYIKYYKGLGTHMIPDDIPSMFSEYEKNLLFAALDDAANKNLNIYYGKDADLRKKILKTPPHQVKEISDTMDITTILNTSVKEFHRDKIARSLPHAIDGLTESRRKVLWAARYKFGKTDGTNKEIKVAALAAFATEYTAYMHGEQCISDTIVLMAQNFPGTNHLPMLMPNGNFGSRTEGGKDAASSRYIYTQLNQKLCYAMFPSEDDYILDFVFDEGQRCEPKYFVPILPMVVLENLSGNIGVGWSSKLWARDIWSVFKNVRQMISKTQTKCKPMKTWLKDNIGDIRLYGGKEYSIGKYIYDSKKNTITVTELPLGIHPASYLEWDTPKPLKKEDADSTDKKTKQIGKSVRQKIPMWARPEFSQKPLCETSNNVKITFYLKEGEYEKIKLKYGNEFLDPIEDYLNLKNSLSSNLNAINWDDSVIEFKKYEDMVNNWFLKRKALYEKRILRETTLLKLNILYLENIIRFMDNEYKYSFTSKTELSVMKNILEKEKYIQINETLLKSPKYTPTELLENKILHDGASYNYLLSLNNIDKSASNSRKRKELLENKKKELDDLHKSTLTDPFIGASVWMKELDHLEKIIKNGFINNWSD